MNPVDLATEIPKRTLIVTVGLPRSGKSTWALSTGLPVVSPDAIRLAVHGRRFHAPIEPFVWAQAKLMVMTLFTAGHKTVILDATNVSRKRRKEWMSAMWNTRFKVFPADTVTCLERLRATGDDAYIAEMVPVIMRMSGEWEPLDPDVEVESDAG